MKKIEIKNGTLWAGDSAEVLKQYPDNHFDSVVTDPPYGIEFLGKDWDNNTGAIEVWKQCLRVLKPGGYMLAFSSARTYHRLATNLEDIGFQIKDQLMWLYGSGFPKSQDVGKKINKVNNKPNNEWFGWGTNLKPAHEPIVMVKKPINQAIFKNVLEYGTGAINIDASRLPSEEWTNHANKKNANGGEITGKWVEWTPEQELTSAEAVDYENKALLNTEGRFPSNVIISEEVGNDLDEKIGVKKYGNKKGGYKYDKTYNVEGFINNNKPDAPSNYGDGGGPSKYFYCPKVNRKERNIGFDLDKIPTWNPSGGYNNETGEDMRKQLTKDRQGIANNHPTVKPTELMKYLVTLITPPNGKVLDPFNGSGSTGMAVKEFGGEYVGIDLDENYIDISNKRINAWSK